MPRLANPHPNVLASSRTVIFGGTSGLGAAVSSAALANGGKVFISSSKQANISAAVTHLQSIYPGCTVSGAAADLSDENILEANLEHVLAEAVDKLGGPLDHIVYTATEYEHAQPLAKTVAKDIFKSWTVKYQGPLMIAKLVAASPGKYLKVVTSSSITCTSGILAHKPLSGMNSGWAGAIEALALTLSTDLKPIRVNSIAPGAFMTELLETLGDKVISQFAEGSLSKRVGTPEEAAEAYLFSMRCGFLTGQAIVVDGGFVAA